MATTPSPLLRPAVPPPARAESSGDAADVVYMCPECRAACGTAVELETHYARVHAAAAASAPPGGAGSWRAASGRSFGDHSCAFGRRERGAVAGAAAKEGGECSPSQPAAQRRFLFLCAPPRRRARPRCGARLWRLLGCVQAGPAPTTSHGVELEKGMASPKGLIETHPTPARASSHSAPHSTMTTTTPVRPPPNARDGGAQTSSAT